MKKIVIPLIAAAFLAAGVGAKAAVVAGTNIVTKVNIQLTYTSPVSTNMTTTTKTITIGKTKVPITYTTTTYVSKSTPVTTASVLAALYAPNAAPKGAYLAHVQSGDLDYFAVRVGDANALVLTNQIVPGIPVADAKNGKSTSSVLGVGISPGGKDVSVVSLALTTASLSFSAQALDVQTATGGSVKIGGFAYPVFDTTYTLIGTGTDAAGANEIVTGTITANGATLGN